MKRYRKITKIAIITLVVMASLLIGTVAAASAYPDNPVLRFFVIENPFTAPEQETFSIVQIFEENGFSIDRIDNIQLAVLPDGGVVTTTNSSYIHAVWALLSELEVTTHGAEQTRINDELSVYVDIQFTDPNQNAGIAMFGPGHNVGLGPFAFTKGSSEQPFIELFTELTNIQVDYTPILHDPDEDDQIEKVPPNETEGTGESNVTGEASDAIDYTKLVELLAANGFSYEELGAPTHRDGWFPVEPVFIKIGEEILTVYEFASNEDMEKNAIYVEPGGFGITGPDFGVQVSWVSYPYWFKAGNIIVIYVGENEEIKSFLFETLGETFAVGRIG